MNATAAEPAWRGFLQRSPRAGAWPLRASIEITRNCNLACVMCPHSRLSRYESWDPARDMAPALFERVVAELVPRLEEVQLQGLGETTLAPHWPSFLERLTRREGRARLKLVTNATRVNDALWARTVEAGVAVAASVDGASSESYRAVRVGGHFETVVDNLRLLGRLGADLALTVTVQRANVAELPLFVDLAARCGARRVDFTRVVSGIPSSRRWAAAARLVPRPVALAARAARRALSSVPGLDGLPEAYIAERREAALARGAALGVEIRLKDPLIGGAGPVAGDALGSLGPEAGLRAAESVAAHGRCAKPYLYAVVRHDGEIGLCNHLIGDEHWESMGNLGDRSFEEIWDGPAFRHARVEHASGRPLNPACEWCYARRTGD